MINKLGYWRGFPSNKPSNTAPILEFTELVLCPRMMLRMNFLQPFARHMRVNLCGGDIRMAEQQLHHAQVRAVIDEMGGKRVPQCMW